MSTHNRIRVIIIAAMVFLGLAAQAQDTGPAAPAPSVDVWVEPLSLQLEAKKPATLIIRITPPAGHHAYLDTGEDGLLLPIEINLSSLQKAGIQVRSVSVPQGEWDEQFHATVFRREATFKYELRALPWAKVGSGKYKINIRSQICQDTTGACYFPETHTHLIQVQVLSVPEESNPLVDSPVDVSKGDTQTGVDPLANNAIAQESSVGLPEYKPRTDRPERGLLGWMLLAFVAGMILNVMPCVLPVVSIKILSFVQQAGQSRRRVLALGLAFAAGMIIVFLALAVGAILLGLGWGQQFQSRTFLVVMIAVVFAFALSLFGVYELGVPSTINGLATSASKEGLGGSFLEGVLATVLATPLAAVPSWASPWRGL